MKYDIIVVGGGHAGCEAAYAGANIGKKVLLITSNKKNIATLPCNPSIGGSAKGIIVREIDALGGIMGRIADKTTLQMKMLNSSKGPAVRSLRAQVDKVTYPQEMLKTLENTKNLTIKEEMVEDLLVIPEIDSFCLKFNIQEVDLAEALQRALDYLKSDTIEIKSSISSDLGLVYADEYRLEQIFVNIIDNICDFINISSEAFVNICFFAFREFFIS